ncbi:hypothetical protein [Mycobacterium aquaticum]|nr:hypothetical protein [Mycobacterium aquaticum]
MIIKHIAGLAITVAIAITTAPMCAGGYARAAPEALRSVKYVVSTHDSRDVHIYYRDIDPPNWADYSHNPYVFSPKVDVHLGEDTSWVHEVTLADPAQWAMVVVSSAEQAEARPTHCEIFVDGVLAMSNEGPSGVLCSIRSW